MTAGVSAIADSGTTCNVPASTYTSSSFDATLNANTAGVLILDGDTTVSSTNVYGLYANGSGSTINSSGTVKIVTNSDDDNGVYANAGGFVGLNNVNIQTTGTTYAQGLIAEDSSTISVAGDATISTTGSGGAVAWRGNEGIVATVGSTVNLNTASIATTGNYSSGIVSGFGMSAVNASGQTRIDTRGQYADAILVADQGNVALTNGALVLTYGVNSAAIRAANGAGTASNQVTVTNAVLTSAQANTIEVNGGASNITLNQTTSRAPNGYVLFNVDNGTALAATGFHDAVKLTPNPAALTLTANSGSVLTGDAVVADDGSTANLTFNGNSLYSGKMTNVTNAAFNASNWNVMGDSNITQNLTNAGGMYFQNLGTTVTVGGNYVGADGSVMRLNTQLGGDGSTTDRLHVIGNTTGTTRLEVRNSGGTGAQTVNGINIVQVDGTSDANSFIMAAPVQAGAYEYTLKQGSALDANDWYLTSKYTTNSPTTCLALGCTNPPIIDIYRPSVAAYTVAQTANADAAFTQISSLHQRMGEQRKTPTDKPQTWGRIIAAGQSNNGHDRFEYDQTTTGFQFGRDLLSQTAATGTQQRAGVTINYTHSNVDARDRVRPLVGLSQNTGSIGSNTIGLGGYYTQTAKNGLYFDAVGQINHLTNKYNDSYGGKSTQHGWQVGVSSEVGQSVANLNGWSVEPQAQLSYLYIKYSDFTDAYSNIHNKNTHNLRGRLGLRLTKDSVIDGKAAQYYGIFNVAHDFIKPKAISLSDTVGTGSNSVRESFDRTYGEVGAGIQGSVSQSTDIYADARYQRSFKGDKEGAQFNVGVKMKF